MDKASLPKWSICGHEQLSRVSQRPSETAAQFNTAVWRTGVEAQATATPPREGREGDDEAAVAMHVTW
ncbi:hypothetical protein PG987_004935 [Apiospora arundinis]